MAQHIGIIGGGPTGLMAAEVAAEAGAKVTVFDAMPSLARKFLMAGKSGLNITHAERHQQLLRRYGTAGEKLEPALNAFTADDVRAWCDRLGIETFVGSSGRVFPKVMKGSPLLRAWLQRLAGQGVNLQTRHRWVGFDGDAVVFETPLGRVTQQFDALVLALGGASWARLGSDAAWVPFLEQRGVALAPFRPANCGFERAWSSYFIEKFAGAPIKAVVASSDAGDLPGEFVISKTGVEGSLIYAHSAALRDAMERRGQAVLTLDLAPGRSVDRLGKEIAKQPTKMSFANRLRKATGLDGVKLALLREVVPEIAQLTPEKLAELIKGLPLALERTRPLDQAISVAGGVAWSAVDERLMLKALPGVFVAGEMLDWEAPTGGYLLTGCFATGRQAGSAAAAFKG